MDTTMKGLPADVLHGYVGSEPRVRVRAGPVVGVVDALGPEVTRAETVMLLHEVVVFAAIVGWLSGGRRSLMSGMHPAAQT